MRKRGDDISPFLAMEVMERAFELEREGRDIIHLEIGEPDFETPKIIREAAIKALREGKTSYTHSLGIMPLREAVAEHYFNKYRADVSPENVVITSGSSPGLLLTFSALVEPGDEVILTNPCYACYPNFIKYVGGVPRFINVDDVDNYELDMSDVKKILNRRTKAILINSPGNPTGTVMAGKKLEEIASLGVTVVSDEIYHGLVYEGEEKTIFNLGEDGFVLNGFSKAYAMTGWRLGYLIAPKKHIRLIQKLQQNLFISANNFVQHAGITALSEGAPLVAEMRNIFNERRKVMVEKAKGVGFSVRSEPAGAFYVMADVSAYSTDSFSFAFEILEEAGVGVTPGVDFGTNAEGFIRLSYTRSSVEIEKAFEKIKGFLESKYGYLNRGG